MRLACLQFDPQLMRVADNQRRADALIARRLRPGVVDVLLLPEMAFTGYCFRDRAEILPYCEAAAAGVTYSWCAAAARRLKCAVLAGFPELADDGRLFNSLLAVDRRGQLVHVYRKHFLYTTDETWASEGPGFESIDIPDVGCCALGICMDVNPKQFKAPVDRFEFASALFDPPLAHHEKPSHHRLRAPWILLANNWLKAAGDLSLGDEEHCRHLVNYWAYRLSPALGQPAIVAIANRVGVERGVHFAGCSCVIDLGSRTLEARLNGKDEDVLIWGGS